MSDLAIDVQGLRKSYGDFEAVRGIDFGVRRGEVFGLLGPNGAGKTTTVEILEGYRERTDGRVEVLGYDPGQRTRAFRSRVGIVLQTTGLYRHIKVREAIAHFGGMYPHPRDVEEVIELTGLDGKEDALARTLSGGQLRRLDLALALVGDPELIFLDEPTTGFDPAARRNAWETIRSLKELGKTVLLTTHYLDEAQALADRVAIIKDGRIIVEGAPQRTWRRARARLPTASPTATATGRLVERETDDPTTLLHELTGAALARGERLEALTVTRPTLEDVYLELTADEARRCLTPLCSPGASTGSSGALFWRNPSAAFFNFLLPLLFLAFCGVILSGNQHELDKIVPGIAGMAVMSTTFTALAYNMVFLRERGVLKRIRGTPMPTISYLARGRRQCGHEHGDADRDRRDRRPRLLRDRLAEGLAGADRVRHRRRHLLRGVRRGVLPRDPELRVNRRIRQCRVPAGGVHLRRVLRRPQARRRS